MSEATKAVAAGEEAKDAEEKKEEKSPDAAPKKEDTPAAAGAAAAAADEPPSAGKKEESAVKDGEEDEDTEMKESPPPAGEEKKKKRKKSSAGAGADSSASKPPVKRERRERKTANTFTPDDFKHVDKSVSVLMGRGTPLGELPAVAESIESFPNTSEELLVVHRLLYTTRGKPPKKDMKSNILAFSGYLPVKDKELDKKAQDALDEELEAKMGTKAYKLQIPQLKRILDMLAVDRSGTTTKDNLVDLLLDFLGAPKRSFLKGSKKSVKKGRPKKKKTDVDDGEEEEAEDDEEEEEAASKDEDDDGGDDDDADGYSDIGDEPVEDVEPAAAGSGKEVALPSDDVLRRWVRAYVRCHNMKHSTIKSALTIANEKFGCDLTELKPRLKELLTEEM